MKIENLLVAFLFVIVCGVVIFLIFYFLKNKDSEVVDVDEVDDQSEKTKSSIISIAIQVLLFLFGIVFLVFAQISLGVSFLLLFTATLYSSIFRVPEVYVAVPSSLFVGRIRNEKDKNGWSIPIYRPFKEGLHYKPFWWTVNLEDRSVKQVKIERQEYQIGSGGTVIVSGLVQYRVSSLAAYRAAEIGDDEIKAGISSEVDQFIIKRLGSINRTGRTEEDSGEKDLSGNELQDQIEYQDIARDGRVNFNSDLDHAIRTRAELSKGLEEHFKQTLLLNKREEETQRILFGQSESPISYSENWYGVEVLTARIDKVDPVDSIKKERDRIEEERYQARSERIQLVHFLNRVKEVANGIGGHGEGVSIEKAVEIAQISMKLTTKEIKEIQLQAGENVKEAVKGLNIGGANPAFIAGLLSNNLKEGGE